MKGFFKFLGTLAALFTAMFGALAIYDNIKNKNRLKGAYLECDCPEEKEEESI